MNKIILTGMVLQEPFFKSYDSSESKILCAKMQTHESWTDKKSGDNRGRSQWHTLVFPKRLEGAVLSYMAQGRKLLVEGRLCYNPYMIENKRVVVAEIEVSYFEFLDDKQLTEHLSSIDDELPI